MSRAMSPALRRFDAVSLDVWDVESIRQHFLFPQAGRIATNNAASTQPPRELLALYAALAPQYENVHRGQSSASQHTTGLFEAAYDDIAQPQQRRAGAQRDRGAQHRHVLAAHRVSRW